MNIKSISEKSFDFSELLYNSYISRISSKKYQRFLEDIFRYVMSNKDDISNFWKDKVSLVLCLEVLERQDIIETDIGSSLQEYNKQLIHQFSKQYYGSRSEDLPFYANLLLYRLSYREHYLEEDKMMFIQLIENLLQDLAVRKIDLTTNAIQFHVTILIKLYHLNIDYNTVIQSELKNIYERLHQTFQNPNEKNLIWMNNLLIYSDLSTFLQKKQLIDLKTVLFDYVANYEEFMRKANWLDRFYFLEALIKFNTDHSSEIFNADIESILKLESKRIAEFVGDSAEFEARMLALTRFAFVHDTKNNALAEMLLIPSFS